MTIAESRIGVCSRKLVITLLMIIFASSAGWAQGLPPKSCTGDPAGIKHYLCPGDLIVTSAGNGTGALIQIDPVTGAQLPISQGNLLQETAGVVVESTGSLVAANRFTGLVRVNPKDGSQQGLASGSYNSSINDYFSIVSDPTGTGAFIVTDSGFNPFQTPAINHPGSVVLTDSNGNVLQTLASGYNSGSPIVHPYGVAVDSNNNIFISDMSAYNGQGAIFELPFIGGNANPPWSTTPAVVWGPSGLTGPNVTGPYAAQVPGYDCPLGITVDPTNSFILATVISQVAGVYGCSQVGGAIFKVDLKAMQQLTFAGGLNPKIVDDPSTGQTYDQWLNIPFGTLFDMNQKVVFVDEGLAAVFRMDPITKYLIPCTSCASATWDPNAPARGIYWHNVDPKDYPTNPPVPLGIVLSGGNVPNVPNLLGKSNGLAMVTTVPTTFVGVVAPTTSCPAAVFTYDRNQHSPTCTATKGVGGAVVSGGWVYSAAGPNAGVYAVTATFTSTDPNYTGAVVNNVSVTISGLPITVVVSPANPTIMVYGGAVPALSAVITPAAAAAIAAADGVTAGASTLATPTSLDGVYAVTPVANIPAALVGNYSVSQGPPGQLTITDAGVTITSITGPTGGPLPIGSQVQITANYTSPGAAAAQPTCTFTTDGANVPPTPPTITYQGQGTGSCTWTVGFTVDDVYTVTVQINDANSVITKGYYKYVVIYNPAAGWVSGNGTFLSAPGSYVPNPTVGGTGKFGFTSKYKKGANVPTGSTRFVLNDAKFRFVGTTQMYMTITGAKAQFTGTGNTYAHVASHPGDGDCDDPTHLQLVTTGAYLILTGIDGELRSGGGGDGIRIKISDPNTKQIIYDNMMGTLVDDPNLFNPQTILTGRVEIHKN